MTNRVAFAEGKAEYSKKMINWPKGKRDTDGIWSKVWYKNVIQSSTFNKFKSEQINVPKKYSKSTGKYLRNTRPNIGK